MKSFFHRLNPNLKNERPHHIIFFDVETTAGKMVDGKIPQLFRYGEALYWRRGEADREDSLEWFQITDLVSFWEWVVSKTRLKTRLIMCSHNLNVDMVVTEAWIHLPSLGFKLQSLYVVGMTGIISFKGRGGTLLFLDNANWWKVKLELLGEMVGYPKLEVDPTRASLPELILYCHRDVEILYQVWQHWFAFLDEHNLGDWGISISSQALKAYTHRFMPYLIYIHGNNEVIELERASYHGGRVEPFWLGEWEGEERYKLDVNSMYPYVMEMNDYPTKLWTYLKSPSLGRVKKLLSDYLLVAEVGLETDLPVYPYLGKEGVFYPIGSFRAILTTPELFFALVHGHLKDVRCCSVYEKAPIFEEYVDYFYPLKDRYTREGNRPYREAVKLMLNCLYGKFGQRGLKDKVMGDCATDLFEVVPTHFWDTNEWGYLIYAGGKIIKRVEGEASHSTFVAIAAHVTAYARMYLWKLICRAGREHVYYCDTDSLLVNRDGYHHLAPLVDQTALGALKLEEVATSGYIKGKKDYMLNGVRVLKGIPLKAEELVEGVFAFDMWPTMRGLLREGDLTHYYIKPMERKLKRELTWGRKGKAGRIFPFSLPGPARKEEKDDGKLEILTGELQVLLQARTFPQKLLFILWDYRGGQLRKGADSLFSAPLYKGIWMDKIMQEYGFTDYNDFITAIEAQVHLNRRIKVLRRRLRHLVEEKSLPSEEAPSPPGRLDPPF